MKEARIYLTGFMTSGKSTIGPILANVLGLNFIDLDKEIEDEERCAVVDIFEQKGEAYFREVESNILKKYSEQSNVVISLGGGTITKKENYDMMKNTGLIIYLKASPQNLYMRLKNKTDRPLFKDLVLGQNSEEDFIKRIKEMLDNRQHFYEKADIIINTDHHQIGITVDNLVKKILRYFNEKD